MKLTFEEIRDRLMQLDEITLLEVLEISSEDLVNRFEDKIAIKLENERFLMDVEELGESGNDTDPD